MRRCSKCLTTGEDSLIQMANNNNNNNDYYESVSRTIRHSRRRAISQQQQQQQHQQSTARRYQPKLSWCQPNGDCQSNNTLLASSAATTTAITISHRNLLLLGNIMTSINRDKFRKCAISKRINSTDKYSLENLIENELLYSEINYVQLIVYISSASNWKERDPVNIANGIIKVIDKLIEHLGNVSLYANDENNLISTDLFDNIKFIVENHCNNHQVMCSSLQNFYLILEQMQQQHTPGLLDVYNTKFVNLESASSTTTSTLTPTLPFHKQLDKLLQIVCERDKSKNRFIEILNVENDIIETPTVDYGESGMAPETSLLLNDILPINPKNYDKNRPPKMAGLPTTVYFHVTVLSLDSINEESMTYVADIFLAQSWRDPRLRLPENMREEYRILDVEWLHSIWRPDCFFKNAKKVTFHEMSIPNHYLWLYHDKTLLYMSKLTLVLSCAMKFESYPHDTQNCSMMIESLSHTTHDLIFLWNKTDPLVVNPEIELPQLDIEKNYTDDCTNEYSTGNFTCLAVHFNLRRRLGYHLFHTYIPSALIVVMSWISFWIKPEAIPARVTLGVTSLLTLATQNTQSQQSLPPVSYVKAIDVWMSSCSVFVFLSLMEFAVVNNYMGPVATKAMKGYSEDDIRSAVDEFKEFEARSWSATRGGRNSPLRASTATQPQYDTFCHGRATALFIDKFSRFFFPFSFLILNVVYWSTFL